MTTLRTTLPDAARRAVAARVEAIFREAGALRDGHFSLKSGRHADRYLEKFQVLQFPAAVSELCGSIAARARGPAGMPLVDVVAGPTTGGVILAFEVARQLGVRAMFAEEVSAPDGAKRREFRRGFRIGAGERVLLVDDILTTGGSLQGMVPAVEAADGRIEAAMVLVDRSGGQVELRGRAGRQPVEALWTLELPTFVSGAESCPGCAKGVPLETPGASGTGSPGV